MEVLQLLTEHVDTGAPLRALLFDQDVAAKNFQSGLWDGRPLEFALFDMRVHHELDHRTPTYRRRAAHHAARREWPWFRSRLHAAHMLHAHFSGGYARATTATNGPKCCR